ncbi:Hypothetical predicted protein [Octopus vulgaris]|uniref:Uncharacterized protein n=1 Tax=Octopus vulgaris TaxID=6645 RepID=A0AA36ART4_OCTVU|nr:Hypothetical predicted protein [Octopus vulgaris]
MEQTVAKQKYIGVVNVFYNGCRARPHTTFNSSTPEVIFSTGSHNHCAHVNARKAVHSTKSEVMRTSIVSSRKVIATAVQNVDEEAQSLLQAIPRLSRNIHNWRQQALRAPALPDCHSGFEIPDAVKYLENRSLFLVSDSGIDDSEF